MGLTIRIDASATVRVFVEGHLDSDSAPDLDQAVKNVMSETAAGAPKVIVFDLNALQYISSAGLRCFVRVVKAGFQPLLINLQPNVEKVFNMVRVLPAGHFFRDNEALQARLAQLQAASP